jgi:hypothetical protein
VLVVGLKGPSAPVLPLSKPKADEQQRRQTTAPIITNCIIFIIVLLFIISQFPICTVTGNDSMIPNVGHPTLTGLAEKIPFSLPKETLSGAAFIK